MSRTTRSVPAETPTPADPSGDLALTTLKDVPAVAALIALVQAMLAVARFPSSPMPVALTDRLALAQQEFSAALDQPAFALLPGIVDFSSEQIGGYDDAWIRDKFGSLEEALKGRFGDVDTSVKTLTETLASLSDAVGEIKSGLSKSDDLADRIAALEAAAPANGKA